MVLVILLMNGDNVTVDIDIGSYWSMYQMMMAIIYIYYDEVYVCQEN